ncbi:SGNH/GDSL hydrolase family protein [Ornithinimicrobium pratense]|uniref:SGNH/GDSL hydrolase family protein n=1 Tax=Ornithinimicrobium pratense TaxID=2593973 RepID=A0A5J6VA23_9MICO|nr:SGNH/GDSL hydrolase family protein [Ornithinimicrobium pratense]QFG69932.1 SGNH/GDSL hydrolase family protein [Ornithinimicrobium pratense]
MADFQDHPEPRWWQRFVALGDSFTEGMVDADPRGEGEYVGWADRLANRLARRNGEADVPFGYANLAIRGRLIDAILEEQLQPALDLTPDLVSLSAGGNDVLRPKVSLPEVMGKLEEATSRIRATGADVILVTAPDVSSTPLVNRVHPRMVEYTAHLWGIGQRTGSYVVDIYTLAALRDPRMWGVDRIHLSSEGHARVAAQAAWTLGLEPDLRDWRQPLEALPPLGRFESVRANREWIAAHLRPWIRRRLRGESSGDGRSAKRPDVLPLEVWRDPVPPTGDTV